MMLARVSNLEAFRRWRLNEEATAEDLISYLHAEESEAMRVGTAFHAAIENSAGGDRISSMGYTFVFECDVAIPDYQLKEVRGNKQYGPLTVTGKFDGMHGLVIADHKTTAFFGSEKYLDGYQWRFYLDIFGAHVFKWNVYVIKQDKDDPNLYSVTEFHPLTAHRYARLHDDCLALAKDYHDTLTALGVTP